jgi:hypothetical protein
MMGKCMMMYQAESASTQTWLCSMYLEFAEHPESIYITNPEFANNVHAVCIDKRIHALSCIRE